MSIKNIQVETGKLTVGNRDWTKPGIPDVLGNGELTCPGISIFGDSIAGGFKACVNIGPPLGNLGKTLPNSLWVEGSSVFIGAVTNFGITTHYGMTTLYGLTVKNAASLKNGVSMKNGLGVANLNVQDNTTHNIAGSLVVGGVLAVGGNCTASNFFGNIALCPGKKNFDIPHPTKKDHRLRHVCVEGPTADVYIRGKLNDNSVIILPDYWKELVDLDGITVSLTPFGVYQELFVKSIENGRVIVSNNAAGPVNCYYYIHGERKDCERNIAEYKGLTISDYPGDNKESIINGV
tara:strand:+ start:3836 stop:4711 length:876 start_codon:yes stop_codon:yes gene_type:complete